MVVSSRFYRSAVTALAVVATMAMLVATSKDRSPAGAERPVSDNPTLPAPGPNRMLVRFADGSSASERADAVRASGLRKVGEIPALAVEVVEAPDGAAATAGLGRLREDKNVAYAEPDAPVEATLIPTDPEWSRQWGNALTNAPEVWSTTTGSSDVVIAVLDSGYSPGLVDVAGQFTAGWDFINNDDDPTDDNGHGTKITGVMAAHMGNGVGLAGWCPECTYTPVKVLGSAGTGTYSSLISGLTWAADRGADVINVSLVGTSDSAALRDAVEYARTRGAVVVAGAGNDYCDCPRYPAAIPTVVSVGASDQLDARASYSSFGSWVDVAAPGSNVTTQPDGSYRVVGGTSSAAPVVAGIAGLLRSARPDATVAQIEDALVNGVVPVGSWVRYGRVDAARALAALGDGSGPTTTAGPATTVAPTTSTTTMAPTSTVPPTMMTTSYSGTASKKRTTYSVATGSGELSLELTANTSAAFSAELVAPSGVVVARAKGRAPLVLRTAVVAGTYTVRISGSGAYSLTVTRPVA